MVLKILPDTRQITHEVDGQRSEVCGRTDAREHEELRRIVRASADDHLAPGGDYFRCATPAKGGTRATHAVQGEALDGRVGDDGEVGTGLGRRQVADCGAAAPAIALGHLMKAEAFLVAGVEVGVERQASRRASLDESEAEAVGALRIDGCERAADAVRIGRAAALILTLLEEGEHVAPRPAVVAERRPAVIVGGMATLEDHGVDGAGTAQHLATREIVAAATELGHRFAVISPILT